MSTKKSSSRVLKTNPSRFITKIISAILIICILTVSVPAAPETITGMAGKTWQKARFAFLSSKLAIDFPTWFAAFISPSQSTERRPPAISSIRIFPDGPVTVVQGQEAIFSAIAYDIDGEPLSGVDFEWTTTDTGRGQAARSLGHSRFRATSTGTYLVKALAGNREAEVRVVVTPDKNRRPARTPVYSTSSRSGKGSRLIAEDDPSTNEKEKTAGEKETGSEETPPQEQLLPGEGWDNTNWQSADDPGNTPGNPPGMPADDGAGSGNFQLSAPVVSLPGRGIDLALNLNYNSRLWNKSGSQISYDIDRGFPAPGWSLGFGKIVSMGTNGGCMIIDADGTRHGYSGAITTWGNTVSFTGHTSDGKFIDYGCQFTNSQTGSAWAKLPNGTSISYSTIGQTDDQALPTRITDAQGNYITITYRSVAGSQIETITDTMGRVITFQYDSLNRLISVKAPRMQGEDPIYGGGTTRTLVKIHYKPLALNYSFASGVTPVVRPGTIYGIDAIYYPATNTGYWFNDADSYSSYGMITKVSERRGMNWQAGPDEQGTITAGQMTKLAEYNYPLTTLNETDRTNGVNLSDAPTYETLKESWDGADVAEPAVTRYKILQNATPRTTSVVQPNGAVSRQFSYNTPGQFTDGLVYSDETYVPDPGGTFTFPDLGLTGNFKRVGRSNVTWAAGEYDSPRPALAEIWDENNNKVRTEYDYTGGRFNQITHSCDYDNNNSRLRCARANYENDPSYIGQFSSSGVYQSGRHIFNLVKSTGIENPDLTRASWTEYEYDNYQAQPFTDAPGVVQHLSSHNPNTTDTQNGSCLMWEPPTSIPGCSYDGEEVWVPTAGGYTATCFCNEWDQVSAYDPATEKRGNITKTTSYADAQNLTGAIIETRGYDITGNLVKASSSCCEQTSIAYDDPNTPGIDTQYAYPVSQTRGSADTNSPNRITTSAVYNFDTGLIKQNTDANGRTSTTGYNPDTLRPVKSTSSTGAYSTFSYDDTAMTVTEEVKESNGTTAGKSKKHLNGIGQVRKEEAFGPSNVIDIVETQYTKFTEEWKQSRPYRTGDTPQFSEKFYDAQGRLTKIVEADGSETKAFYNETQLPGSVVSAPGNKIRVMDAWGRERWGRYDQQGRLTEVVEPNPDVAANPTGSVFAAGSLLTKYNYDTLGRLKDTDQGGQIRKFKYDDLGRLTRQKLAEQTATLNDSGQYVGAGNANAKWSEAFFFDNRSNLIAKTDARGVKTNLSYQISGADDPLNRIQSRSYDLSGPLDPNLTIYQAPGVTYEYMTTGDKSRIKKIRTAGFLTEEFAYDVESRVSEFKQTVDYRTSYPMTTNYLYDTLDRVKEVTYPAQYGLAGNPRKIVAHTYDTASRLTNMTFGGQQQAGDIVYNASSQTTSIKIGTAGNNQVTENYTFDQQTGLLTNQKAIKNETTTPTTLLDLSYEYNRNGSAGSLNGKTGHLTKIINNLDNNKNREYEFDAVGRLTKAKGGVLSSNFSWQQQYSYDRFGNRTNVTATGAAADGSAIPRDGIPNLVYNTANNRITTAGFEYDSAGNQKRALAEDGVTWVKYEYDAANRIQVVKKDDANQTTLQAFQYGSTNARLMDLDYGYGYLKIFASVGGTTLAEYTEFTGAVPTWTKSHIYLGSSQLSTITPNGSGGEYTEYNHPDRLGTRVITNQAGGTSYEQAHLPFGRPLDAESTTTGNHKRFTSYDRSARTGLDYAVNRTYDSKQGRFTQVDPIGMSAASAVNPQTLNMYTYCGNDPINYVDPSGLFFGKLFKWIGKIFRAISRILKWVVIAVVVAAVVIAIFHSGGAAAGFLKAIFGIVGKILGIKLTTTPLILNFAAGTISGGTIAISVGLSGKIIAGLYAVGAIANSFAQTKDGKKKRQDIIGQTVLRVIARLKNQKCLKTINHDGYDLSPADALSEISTPGGTGDIVYNSTLAQPAQTVVNQTDAGVIELGPSFFKKIIKDARGNDWNKITGLNEHRTREFIVLHELRHLFGSNHSGDQGLKDDITKVLKDCFGVTPDFSGGIK